MTIDDAKTRFLANRAIADPVARNADMATLRADMAAEWGEDKVDPLLLTVVVRLQLEGPI